MKIVIEIIGLLIGFLFLIKGADFFVEGSAAVAHKLRIPTVVVGLTIVAVGTSLPELAVSTLAAAAGSNEMALGNVVGSNIFNALMVLGISAVFITTNVKKSLLRREFPFLAIVTVATIVLAGDVLWFGNIFGKINLFEFQYKNELIGTIGRVDGLFLIILFVFFIGWTVSYALRERNALKDTEFEDVTLSTSKCILFIILGVIAILAGGQIVVYCAKDIALKMGMGETLVGLTVVALGTSLPELVTSAVAAKKGEADLAVGNVVGSNISNILLVLGLSSAIKPVGVTCSVFIDLGISLLITFIVYIVAFSKKVIKKGEGIFLIGIYLLYLTYIILRQYM